jgi:hypothetical protein
MSRDVSKVRNEPAGVYSHYISLEQPLSDVSEFFLFAINVIHLRLELWTVAPLSGRGKSGLHRAAQGITSLHLRVRNSGTERMSGALSLELEMGGFRGAAGVKTAKLCAEQDQIGRRLSAARTKSSGRSLEGFGNKPPRGMMVTVNLARRWAIGGTESGL